MLIASQKRRENIADYLIYMYRNEALIRSFDLDIKLIKEHVVKNIEAPELEKQKLTAWYQILIDRMKTDKVEQEGHLQELIDIVKELDVLHEKLKGEDSKYQEHYNISTNAISKNLKQAKGLITSEIQICLNAMFGYLLLKSQGKSVPEGQEKILENFGNLLSYLSFAFLEEELKNKADQS